PRRYFVIPGRQPASQISDQGGRGWILCWRPAANRCFASSMHYPVVHKTAAALAIFFAVAVGPLADAQTNHAPLISTNTQDKELLIPQHITRVPEGNDFNEPNSEFSFKHSKSTGNFVLFWAKEYGDDPMANAVTNRRFKVDEILKECDRFYD